MQTTITGRHLEITEAIHDYVMERFKALEQHFGFLPIHKAHVILSVNRFRHKAEIDYHCEGAHMCCVGKSSNLYNSIDVALTKLERQLKKYQAKRNRHYPNHNREQRDFMHGVVVVPEVTETEQTKAD